LSGPRPPVSVVVPFRGNAEDAERMFAALRRLELRKDDELIVSDNSGWDVHSVDGLAVVPAKSQRSSYYARNTGAAETTNPWLLFTDSDCIPVPNLLDAYFDPPPADRTAAVAGSIVGDPGQTSLLARYARDRNFLDQSDGMHVATGDSAATGNLLIRREAFDEIGGFEEGIRSGGDIDLCWRLRDAGWDIERRPEALVEHRHRDHLVPFLAMIARYAAGSRWLNNRYPNAAGRWPLPKQLAIAGADAARHARHGRGEAAIFRLIDGLGLIAHNVGYLASNHPRGRA
jgi:GT2 family glycosyltransferase